jgi:hypothetical protein
MRPSRLYVGGILYWTIQTRNPDTLVLKDADSNPTVAVRKNGASVGDSVTVTKRSATTGLYDCSYNPAGEAANDTFQFEELATITGTTTAQAEYPNQFVVSVEGTAELDSGAVDDIAAPILAALQGSSVVQVASPNVQGNLVLTQGDDYDGVANPRAQWTVATDYTIGWTVRLTIRDTEDAVVYTTVGSVVSATVVAVTIAAPAGLEMTGCPGQWQGKFDVELTHSTGKKKTIALGTCYINEDQTRA